MGFLDGFLGQRREYQAQADRDNEQERARNERILQTLAGSDDPEIRASAVTAMLSGAAEGKVGKGLSGFFGAMRQHPLFSALTSLVNSPVQETDTLGNGKVSTGMPGTEYTPQGNLPSRAARMDQATTAVGAPPPAAAHLGTPVTTLTHPAPRQIFLDPAERAKRNASAALEGRITGGVGAYKTLTGNDMSNEDIEDVTRGAMGAPRRRSASRPGTLTLRDGTTIAGSFDPDTGTYVDADGNPQTEIKSFTPGNPNANANAGAFTVHTPDKASPTGWSAVRKTPDGHEIDRTPIAAPAPPGMLMSTVSAPSGVYGVTKGGGTVPLQIPKGVDPATYAEHLHTQMQSIMAAAKSATPSMGTLNDPEENAKQLDVAAKAAGFPQGWAQVQATYAEAVKAVGTGVPAAGAPPPAAQHPGRGTAPAAKKPQSGDLFGILTGAGRGGG